MPALCCEELRALPDGPDAPAISVEVGASEFDAGSLKIRWRLTNLTYREIDILETWLPHNSLFADRVRPKPPLSVRPDSTIEFGRVALWSRPENGEVENAFLNLAIRYAGTTSPVWRFLIRMRVSDISNGAAAIRLLSMTSHEQGFADSRRQQSSGAA
jgi:hypothetical protein